ncbi:hypothetical protein KGO04_00130 [Patescibacteria group bacterium]|nr:hypothetical protein [Patescibacteria group bacterium]MDE1944633.1 hypothetical protein [Patescibacteria group bacterium]MDE1945513.1 hypothetical protein [Patescibacteria group bacterium]
MNYYKSKYERRQFAPKKPVKTFRDLDIYQKTLECAVIVMKNVRPKLAALKYPFLDGMTDCAMNVPLAIGEAHSIRFADFAKGLGHLERAMSGCNKMIIYLEHAKGMHGAKADPDSIIDELVVRYAESRTKSFRLEQSWKKWRQADAALPAAARAPRL